MCVLLSPSFRCSVSYSSSSALSHSHSKKSRTHNVFSRYKNFTLASHFYFGTDLLKYVTTVRQIQQLEEHLEKTKEEVIQLKSDLQENVELVSLSFFIFLLVTTP